MPADPSPAAARVALPPEGGAVAVAPGVHWVRMPLPFALDHINLWLLEDGDGWTIADTGYNSEATRALWLRLFDGVLAGRPVHRVLCTHFHPDHMGLAGWLVGRTGATFATSLTEWLYGRALSLDTSELAVPPTLSFYRRAGAPEAVMERLAVWATAYRASVSPIPAVLHRLRDGDRPMIGGVPWRVVVGRGHAPEQVCLHAADRRVLIAGDQVLERISPNVSVWPNEPDADPLGDFLDSIAALTATIPDDVLILPSHGVPFTGLHARLAALAAHHAERLNTCRAACDRPHTAWEVTRALFTRDLDPHQMRFAVGETLAHLNHLVHRGALHRHRPDDGGADRYVAR
ncbi:MBL fold metallo-hydrolase [Azospirillum halopraeferens]|uniref:MBL fold metallo-hydrolase n=1 Tax=Azospirillum halopraeferens TaxID=34010 RepID=UPI000401EB0E|nr:MBL fold metallo-hydrolase [Azospirillum halopraeferens]